MKRVFRERRKSWYNGFNLLELESRSLYIMDESLDLKTGRIYIIEDGLFFNSGNNSYWILFLKAYLNVLTDRSLK